MAPSVLPLLPLTPKDSGATPTEKASLQMPHFIIAKSEKGHESRAEKTSFINNVQLSRPHSVVLGNSLAKNQLPFRSPALTRRIPRIGNDSVRAPGKSHQECFSDLNRKMLGQVRIYVIDDNNRILDRNKEDTPSGLSSETRINNKYETEVEKETMSSSKFSRKPARHRLPPAFTPNAKSTLDSSCCADANSQAFHKELEKIKPSFGRAKRVKIKADELPRCKTPLYEYDPDKLNMNHVIAFLQSKGELFTSDKREEQSDTCSQHVSIHDSLPAVNCFPDISELRQTGNCPRFTNGAVDRTAMLQSKQLTPHRYSCPKLKSYAQLDVSSRNSVEPRVKAKNGAVCHACQESATGTDDLQKTDRNPNRTQLCQHSARAVKHETTHLPLQHQTSCYLSENCPSSDMFRIQSTTCSAANLSRLPGASLKNQVIYLPTVHFEADSEDETLLSTIFDKKRERPQQFDTKDLDDTCVIGKLCMRQAKSNNMAVKTGNCSSNEKVSSTEACAGSLANLANRKSQLNVGNEQSQPLPGYKIESLSKTWGNQQSNQATSCFISPETVWTGQASGDHKTATGSWCKEKQASNLIKVGPLGTTPNGFRISLKGNLRF